jgi:ribonucleotide reductase beta subunit family protein with ferritin-like domain
MDEQIKAKIKQRRFQMMVHSYIYYELDDNIISDAKWAEWAHELEDLQNNHPEESKDVKEYYKDFIGWDGSSGAFLKFDDRIKKTAKRLLDYRDKKGV